MSVLLALPRGIKVDKPRLIDFGGPLRPPMGGAVQTLHRLGTRFALELTAALVRTEPDGRAFAARLMAAKLSGARLAFPQDGFDPGMPGVPVVDGSGQSGMVLNLKGMRPGYIVREGQFFSLVHAGRRHLHCGTANIRVGDDGKVALPILPMLRVLTTDGDACEFAAPQIEGSLSGNEVAWNRMTSPFTDFGTIIITEDE